MVRTITTVELAESLDDVLSHVQDRNERVVVERNGKPIVSIIPALQSQVVPRVSLREVADKLKGIEMPGEGFADDLEDIQANQQKVEVLNWPS